LNQGPFPQPALPGVIGTTGLSATPLGPARPSRGAGWPSHAATDGASRVACGLLCMHAAATTPAEPLAVCRSTLPSDGSLPQMTGGSASALSVSRPAQRSLALRPACSLGRPRQPVTPEYFDCFVTSAAAPIATGWSDSCRAGILSRWSPTPLHGIRSDL